MSTLMDRNASDMIGMTEGVDQKDGIVEEDGSSELAAASLAV